MSSTGSCLCGAVKYAAEEIKSDFHSCHCSICRRWSGGPAFSVEVKSISFEGEENITRFDSSDWAERGFCNKCGSNLFYHMKGTDQYIVCLGTFHDQTPFKVESEIYIDEKPDSYNLAGDHPRLTGEEFMATLGMS